MGSDTYYEIHLSIDGHVSGHSDRVIAEAMAGDIEEDTPGQTAEVVEVEW